MLRLYPEMKALTQGMDKVVQAKKHASGYFVHPKTGLILKSEPEGFFLEDGNFELGDILVVREDFPLITKVSLLEVTDDPAVVSTGCGVFAYKETTVKISNSSVCPAGNFMVSIISNNVSSFNTAVDALKNGDLKPVDSEQTVFQVMSQKVLDLEKQLVLAKENEAINIKSIEKLNYFIEDYLNKLKRSMFLVREYLACRGEYPDGIENTELARLRDEVRRFKNRTFWQRLWDLPPVPIEKH